MATRWDEIFPAPERWRKRYGEARTARNPVDIPTEHSGFTMCLSLEAMATRLCHGTFPGWCHGGVDTLCSVSSRQLRSSFSDLISVGMSLALRWSSPDHWWSSSVRQRVCYFYSADPCRNWFRCSLLGTYVSHSLASFGGDVQEISSLRNWILKLGWFESLVLLKDNSYDCMIGVSSYETNAAMERPAHRLRTPLLILTSLMTSLQAHVSDREMIGSGPMTRECSWLRGVAKYPANLSFERSSPSHTGKWSPTHTSKEKQRFRPAVIEVWQATLRFSPHFLKSDNLQFMKHTLWQSR